MCRLMCFLLVSTIVSGCTTLSPVKPEVEPVKVPLPSLLVSPCESYSKYLSSDMESVILVHTENMEKAVICKNKHNELIMILRERKL